MDVSHVKLVINVLNADLNIIMFSVHKDVLKSVVMVKDFHYNAMMATIWTVTDAQKTVKLKLDIAA